MFDFVSTNKKYLRLFSASKHVTCGHYNYIECAPSCEGHITNHGYPQLTREGFLRKNIVAVSFFQNSAIH